MNLMKSVLNIKLREESFANVKIPQLLLTIIIFSIGLKFSTSRFGVRLDQILAIVIACFGCLFILQKKINKYIFLLFLLIFVFVPIFSLLTESYVYVYKLQGFFRMFGFTIMGYVLFCGQYNKIIKYNNLLVWLVLFLSYCQIFKLIPGSFFHMFYPGAGALHNYEKLPSSVFGLSEYTSSFVTFGFVYYVLKYLPIKILKVQRWVKMVVIMSIFFYFFVHSEAYSVLLMNIYFLVFYLCIARLNSKKKIFIFSSLGLLFLLTVTILFLLNYTIGSLKESSSTNTIANGLYIRLAITWFNPLSAWLTDLRSFFFGVGLSVDYADSGYFAFIGNFGLVGITLIYAPIFLLLINILKYKKDDFHLNVFFYTTLLLLGANITYPLFQGGKFSDVYWFLFGLTIRYFEILKEGSPNETLHNLS